LCRSIGFSRAVPSPPDDIKVVSDAFEAALRELNLVDSTDPATELVAKTHAVDPKRLAKELGFALTCFRELMTLFLDFFEQPHILDRDQRLVSEKGPAR
jgi:hypothetical protein